MKQAINVPLPANTNSQNVLFVSNRSNPPSGTMSRDILVIFRKKTLDWRTELLAGHPEATRHERTTAKPELVTASCAVNSLALNCVLHAHAGETKCWLQIATGPPKLV